MTATEIAKAVSDAAADRLEALSYERRPYSTFADALHTVSAWECGTGKVVVDIQSDVHRYAAAELLDAACNTLDVCGAHIYETDAGAVLVLDCPCEMCG